MISKSSQPSASNFKSFSRSLEQFFLTVGQNNFGNKIPFLSDCHRYTDSLLDEKKKRPDRTPDVIAKFLIFLAELSEKKHNFWLAFMYNDVTNVAREGKY